MAIYHCSIKIISRGKGKSAVAAAAYRAGEKILNQYDGLEHVRQGNEINRPSLLRINAAMTGKTFEISVGGKVHLVAKDEIAFAFLSQVCYTDRNSKLPPGKRLCSFH